MPCSALAAGTYIFNCNYLIIDSLMPPATSVTNWPIHAAESDSEDCVSNVRLFAEVLTPLVSHPSVKHISGS